MRDREGDRAGRVSRDYDVSSGRISKAAVGGDQRKVKRDRQLDVQGIDQPQLMTSRPGVDEQITHTVSLDRCSSEPSEPGLDVSGINVPCAVQSAQNGEDFGVEVGWCMQRVAREPPANGATEFVGQQEVHDRRGIDDHLSHGA